MQQARLHSRPSARLLLAAAATALPILVWLGSSQELAAEPRPDQVIVVGTLQQPLGCSENWAPACPETALVYDDEDDVWQRSFELPAGSYAYKVALNGSWDVNYGAGGLPGGADIALELDTPRTVKFYFRHGSHWIADDVNHLIPVAVGDFQQVLGCAGNWDPACLRGWLEDPGGIGGYHTTAALPAGDFEAKVAMNESWALNYGLGGEPNGANIPFQVERACSLTQFNFDDLSNVLSVAPAPPPSQPASVTIAGNLQQALGCADNWSPECTVSQLVLADDSGVWRGEFTLPAGSYEYKAALNGSWMLNYGAGGVQDGANIGLVLDTQADVRFYYADDRHWVTDHRSSPIAVVVGDFQQALGCAENWQPECLAGWLQDPDSDGLFTFQARLPAGNYAAKVAINESWGENYGAGGAPGGANIDFEVPEGCGLTYFSFASDNKILTVSSSAIAPRGNLAEARAHFIDARTLAWNGGSADAWFALHASADATLRLTDAGVEGGEEIGLTAIDGGLSPAQRERFPHLASYRALSLPALPRDELAGLLRGQLALSARSAQGQPLDATGIQIPGVVDAMYSTDRALGPVVHSDRVELHVWAPTARSVHLLLFPDSNPTGSPSRHDLDFDPDSGVWSIVGPRGWNRRYYLYEVEVYAPSTRRIETNQVTDPYSLSLAADSTLSQIVDLDDPALMPPGFRLTPKPTLAAHVDSVLYELHVRDFSIDDDSVPAAERGTFAAFARLGSNGMQHLRRLARAGFTHVHLLPVFDQANIPERRGDQQSVPLATLASLPPDASEQQALIGAIRDLDGFNWGYDPWHYTVPEGSYSTDPDGPWRIYEFRQMVQALNLIGLRVVKDVVYNHTNAAGQNGKSVLDRIVPGYYHRLNAAGYVEQSSCCPNTASEHAMMERLMIDSVLTWARAYRIDGFRFDLMGHHSRDNMLKLRAALDRLNRRDHAVDGPSILLYGEGWNFGEVANDARFIQATQANLAGTGIGTFSDRTRDGSRGGNPFGDRRHQGFVSGLYVAPNGVQGNGENELAELRHLKDWLRIGLAADLRDFELVNSQGQLVRADQVDYFGQRAGYTGDPAEHVKYTEAHDNETLFDALQLKLAANTPMTERVRAQNLAHSLMLLGQGIPFFHAGQEILRSKSGDRDSYNSGDWFNAVDWRLQRSTWGRGLPPTEKNQDAWPILAPLLADPSRLPQHEHMRSALEHMLEMTRVRFSSRLFRLRSGEQIQAHLRFHNTGPAQAPGLLVLELADETGAVERRWRRLVALINADPESVTYSVGELAGQALELHPILRVSSDPRVRTASVDAGQFTIPGRTSAVFVERRPALEQLGLLRADVLRGRDEGRIRALRASALLSLLDAARSHVAAGRRPAAIAILGAFSTVVVVAAAVGDVEAQTADSLVEYAVTLSQSLH